jgi:hypothetical protein
MRRGNRGTTAPPGAHALPNHNYYRLMELLHRNALGQVTWQIDIRAIKHSDIIGQQL